MSERAGLSACPFCGKRTETVQADTCAECGCCKDMHKPDLSWHGTVGADPDPAPREQSGDWKPLFVVGSWQPRPDGWYEKYACWFHEADGQQFSYLTDGCGYSGHSTFAAE